MQTIDVKQLSEKRSGGEIDLIDVRMPTEFREVHAECARSVPLESLDPAAVMASRNGNAGHPLYVICRSGNRSSQACQKFLDAGFENVVNVEGGTMAWEKAGLPVVRGKKSLPLMQQVQITAGFLVVLGVALSLLHPYFIGLSAFVGAGLMFAGITGLCPMASFIAKMPWNQCSDGGSCCSTT
ncbi:rhodanese-like domain-containing protein [Stieleria varia]|uniref:Inner membrane protein YgaP n=1 Tax=Stieleria varia TaxID=2528005 RepID=A0A5C6AGL9_9BACT|nr:rhodanese-like domain-containing protein [Stieleria varia]TWT98211.1 Inner membrane protein YgaP [Stieleria varia]